MGAVVIIIIILLVGAALRQKRIAALTARSLLHRRLGPDGIVVGGNGFTRERPNAPAVLLLHGAGDTPQTLQYLGDYLFARGFHVECPLLPGHGRTVGDFARLRADDLTQAAHASYDELRAKRGWVGIIGLSMGGALGVQVAAEHPDLPALGLAAPYLEMPRRIERAARLSWLWGIFSPIVDSADGLSIFDPAERDKNLAYGVFTAGALRALSKTVRRAESALPGVRTPTLVIQSREDNRISQSAAGRAFAKLGAPDKHIEWISGSAHVITVDYGHEHVFEMLASWLERHGAVPVNS